MPEQYVELNGVEIKVTTQYYYQPYESPEEFHPGYPEHIELESIIDGWGRERINDVTVVQQVALETEAAGDV